MVPDAGALRLFVLKGRLALRANALMPGIAGSARQFDVMDCSITAEMASDGKIVNGTNVSCFHFLPLALLHSEISPSTRWPDSGPHTRRTFQDSEIFPTINVFDALPPKFLRKFLLPFPATDGTRCATLPEIRLAGARRRARHVLRSPAE
jgi:hypothetical protein